MSDAAATPAGEAGFVLSPKIFAVRGAVGPAILFAGLIFGAQHFHAQQQVWIAGALAAAAAGCLALTTGFVTSRVHVDRLGVTLRNAFSRKSLRWDDLRRVEIAEMRASTPLSGDDVERTIVLHGAPGDEISVNLTAWSGFDRLEEVVAQRRFGGTYELLGSKPRQESGCSGGSCD